MRAPAEGDAIRRHPAAAASHGDLAKCVVHVILLGDCWLRRIDGGGGDRARRAAASSGARRPARASGGRPRDGRSMRQSHPHAGTAARPWCAADRARSIAARASSRRPAAASAQARASSVNTSRRTVSSRSVSDSACCASVRRVARKSATRSRIRGRPVLQELLLDRRRLRVQPASSQGVRQRPLIFGKRIELHRTLERLNGFLGAMASEPHATARQERSGVIRLKGERRIDRLRSPVRAVLAEAHRSRGAYTPTRPIPDSAGWLSRWLCARDRSRRPDRP